MFRRQNTYCVKCLYINNVRRLTFEFGQCSYSLLLWFVRKFCCKHLANTITCTQHNTMMRLVSKELRRNTLHELCLNRILYTIQF